jgi:hypothetical protein
MDTKPIETDNPHTLAVDPASIPEITNSSLLERLRAELAQLETRVSAVVHTVGADIKAILTVIEGNTKPVAGVAVTHPAPAQMGPWRAPVKAAPPAAPAKLPCGTAGCGHSQTQHLAGKRACIAPGCKCKTFTAAAG